MGCAKRTLRLTDGKPHPWPQISPAQAMRPLPSTRIPRKVPDRPRRSSPPAHAAHDTLRYLSTTPSDFDIRLLEKFAAPPLVPSVKINIDVGSGRIPLNRSAAPCGTVAG